MNFKQVVPATLAGAVVMFVWGMVSWTVLPWHDMTIQGLDEDSAVIDATRKQIAETGVYMYPTMPKEMEGPEHEAFEQAHQNGPIVLMHVVPEGGPVMPGAMFGIGFLLQVLCAGIASVLLFKAAPNLCGYCSRVLFVGLLGLFAGLASDMQMWNWMYQPTDYSLVNLADKTVGWLLAGLVIGAIVKPGVCKKEVGDAGAASESAQNNAN